MIKGDYGMLPQKKAVSLLIASFMAALLLALAACSTQPTLNNDSLVTSLNSQGSTTLDHYTNQLPTDTAVVVWSAQKKTLVVALKLTGLTPNSRHPAHIHKGDCTSNGPILFPLNDVVADKNGNALTITTIPNEPTSIPATGWYINVHHGPTLATPAEMTPIFCGNIVNTHPAAQQIQTVLVALHPLFVNRFPTVSEVSSTVPANGDVNPYGVAVVQQSVGDLVKGNILVSNFNNKANQQGTGTTIDQIAPDGTLKLFAQLPATACPDGIGLTTALVELKRGWVIVGSLPAANGMAANAKAGCLIVLDSNGKVAQTFRGGLINGPWDAIASENEDGSQAALFVTNLLNGTVAANGNTVNQGTVVRFNLNVPHQWADGQISMTSATIIATGFAEKTDPNALVLGPTGVGLGRNGVLYVADTLNSRIIAIPDARTRRDTIDANKHVFSKGVALDAPLGLTIAPTGDILTVNANNGNIVEIALDGSQVATKQLSNMGTPPGAGCLFGLATVPNNAGVYFVDDCTNQLNILH